MRMTANEFRHWPRKAVTLVGMSGVGKTRLATLLRHSDWFHYSGDYRIGTRYLGEAILDNIKRQAMQIPFLSDLLRSDSIYISNNISIDNLTPVSSFLGKLGNPEQGGLSLTEFKTRQRLHHDAELAAMRDVPMFIDRAEMIYGYHHFVNDAGGSLCELDDPDMLDVLDRHTLLLYIKTTEQDERELIARAEASPKPLYYREAFLDAQVRDYMALNALDYVALIDPDAFVRWVFPKLFAARVPRYEALANRYGYTVSTDEIQQVRDEHDFLALVEEAVARSSG